MLPGGRQALAVGAATLLHQPLFPFGNGVANDRPVAACQTLTSVMPAQA